MSDTGNFNPDQETTYDPNCPRFQAARVYPAQPAVVIPGSFKLFPAEIITPAKYTSLSVVFNDNSTKNFPQA